MEEGVEKLISMLQEGQKLLHERQEEQSKRMDLHWEGIQGLLKIQNAQAQEITSLKQELGTLQGEVETWLKR